MKQRSSFRKDNLKRYNLSLVVGGGVVALLLATALIGAFYTPHPPARQNIPARLSPPSSAHLFGTDHLGRDTLSRLMEGAGNSLLVAFLAVGAGAFIGIAVGMASGMLSSWIDEPLMRATDFIMGFPIVLLAILLTTILGKGMRNSMIAIAVANIPVFARLVRGNLLSLREREFVVAARASGNSTGRILLIHLLPNLLSPLIIQGTVSLGTALLADAGLSYLGLGVQPPHASWGRMIYEARLFLFLRQGPWLTVFPGGMIALAILGFNLLGDGLRDRLDPHSSYRLRATRRAWSR
ncbi:ABC transporter permease [Candidatus Bipolaricaulota bacterium]|nr:ABC transporter permease [Candidatus Bipolaricaulota bacterium]